MAPQGHQSHHCGAQHTHETAKGEQADDRASAVTAYPPIAGQGQDEYGRHCGSAHRVPEADGAPQSRRVQDNDHDAGSCDQRDNRKICHKLQVAFAHLLAPLDSHCKAVLAAPAGKGYA